MIFSKFSAIAGEVVYLVYENTNLYFRFRTTYYSTTNYRITSIYMLYLLQEYKLFDILNIFIFADIPLLV